MTIIKNTYKQLLKIIIFSIIYILLLTILHYFNITNEQINNYLRFIGVIIIIFFNTTNMSRKIEKNNVLNGLVLGGSFALILFIISLILGNGFSLKSCIYYLLIILVTILSSSRKKKKKISKY